MSFAGLDDARFALGASKRLARIDTLENSVDIFTANGLARAVVIFSTLVAGRFRLATDGNVVGITHEPVPADTRRPVSIRHADGIGSALVAGTGVDATPDAVIFNALIQRKTNFTAGTIQIVTTRRNRARTSGLSGIARKTDALSVPAGRVRSASDSGAGIFNIRLDGRLEADGHTHHERIA